MEELKGIYLVKYYLKSDKSQSFTSLMIANEGYFSGIDPTYFFTGSYSNELGIIKARAELVRWNSVGYSIFGENDLQKTPERLFYTFEIMGLTKKGFKASGYVGSMKGYQELTVEIEGHKIESEMDIVNFFKNNPDMIRFSRHFI